MKIKHDGYYYGEIDTLAPAGEWAISPAELRSHELAQLFVDLWTLPQPNLRPAEPWNLARAILSIGVSRLGKRFYRLIAQRLLASPYDERRPPAAAPRH